MSSMSTAQYLHDRFNPHDDHIPPVRVKGLTRAGLATLLRDLGYEIGAEIGVAEGHYSQVLCEQIPGLKLYCVDLWDVYYRGETRLKDRGMQDQALRLAHEKLDRYGATFIRKASELAACDFEDQSLDFVYIDGDHAFDFVMLDLILWSRKVRPGGIIAGHDYYRFRGAGVVNAVDAFTTAHQIREWYLDDQRETSFFWVKP